MMFVSVIAAVITISQGNDDSFVLLPALGGLRGIVQPEIGTRSFRGVPFAAPPIGDLRWMPPQPLTPWSPNVFQAIDTAPQCAQTWDSTWATMKHDSWHYEDCLYMDITTPVTPPPPNELYPVMIYIYGGGYYQGSVNDEEIDARGMVAFNQSVIVVVPNYRVGVFGTLGAEQLRVNNGTTGNWGLLDQRACMVFVQKYIQNFGGDPNRVTIFGQSSGAGSISSHLSMDGSRGLFQKAIMQSGAFVNWASKPMANAQVVFEALAKRVGCDSTNKNVVACMRSVSTHKMTRESYAALPFGDTWNSCQWAPVIDGVEQKEEPRIALASGRAWVVQPNNTIDIVIGSNSDDGTDFATLTPDMSTSIPLNMTREGFITFVNIQWGESVGLQLLSLYVSNVSTVEPVHPPTGAGWRGAGNGWWWAATKIVGDHIMTCPSRRAARWLSNPKNVSTTNSNVYMYNWAYAPSDPRPHDNSIIPGACHSCELVFVFNRKSLILPSAHAGIKNRAALQSGFGLIHGETERTIAQRTTSACISFAAGSPQLNGSLWPKYVGNVSENLVVMATNTTVLTDFRKRECDLWDQLPYPDPK